MSSFKHVYVVKVSPQLYLPMRLFEMIMKMIMIMNKDDEKLEIKI